jgi:PleD family two-component response regulator
MTTTPRTDDGATRPENAPAAHTVFRTIREIVIVDSDCERYADFVEAAQRGEIGLHFCVDGRSAVRLARRFRADCWLVSGELPDMSGFDLLEMLSPHVLHGSVDPLLGGATISLNRIGQGLRSGVFMISDAYTIEDEQRALISGVAGYLVRPVTLDMIRTGRSRAGRETSETVAGA